MRKMCTEDSQKPISLSADEALAFLLEYNFTKEQCNAMRQKNKLRNCDIHTAAMKIVA